MESLTRENYFQFGNSLDNFAVTSSSLQHLHPSQGGSILRFKSYISGTDQKSESMSLDRGSLVHQYLENPEGFKMYPANKPSEAVCEVIQDVYNTILMNGVALGTLDDHRMQIIVSAQKFRYGVGGKWTSDTILKKILEGSAYYDFLCEADGSVMVDSGTKEILMNIMSTFENDDELRRFIEDRPQEGVVVYKEEPILFQHEGFMCKSLLDRFEVDFEKKIVRLFDYKTTSKAVGLYMGSSVFVMNEEGEPVVSMRPGAFQEYHTYRQLAFYQLAISAWLIQKGYDPRDFQFGHAIIACETISPYEVKLFYIPMTWLKKGLMEIRTCFEILKKNVIPQQYEY